MTGRGSHGEYSDRNTNIVRTADSMLSCVFKIFYWLYLLGGFTDAIDGTVARKMGTVSDFGSKFDTVADFVFAISIAIKILPTLSFPGWMIIWIVIIALIKMSCHFVIKVNLDGLNIKQHR